MSNNDEESGNKISKFEYNDEIPSLININLDFKISDKRRTKSLFNDFTYVVKNTSTSN